MADWGGGGNTWGSLGERGWGAGFWATGKQQLGWRRPWRGGWDVESAVGVLGKGRRAGSSDWRADSDWSAHRWNATGSDAEGRDEEARRNAENCWGAGCWGGGGSSNSSWGGWGCGTAAGTSTAGTQATRMLESCSNWQADGWCKDEWSAHSWSKIRSDEHGQEAETKAKANEEIGEGGFAIYDRRANQLWRSTQSLPCTQPTEPVPAQAIAVETITQVLSSGYQGCSETIVRFSDGSGAYSHTMSEQLTMVFLREVARVLPNRQVDLLHHRIQFTLFGHNPEQSTTDEVREQLEAQLHTLQLNKSGDARIEVHKAKHNQGLGQWTLRISAPGEACVI